MCVCGRNTSTSFFLTTEQPLITLLDFPPAQFNQKVRNKLPQLVSNDEVKRQEVQRKDDKAKAKMKVHADTRSKAKPSKIKIGDLVLARQRKWNKLSTCFDPSPFHVEERNNDYC